MTMATPLQRTFDLMNVSRILKQSGPGLFSPQFGSTPLVSAGAGGVTGNFQTLPSLSLEGQDFQFFMVKLKNNGGTLQHLIHGDFNNNGWGAWHHKIRGLTDVASPKAYVNTPSVGAGTAHSGGGGIVSGTNIFSFDTGPQEILKFAGIVRMDYNNTNTAAKPVIYPAFLSRNIGGVTINRLELVFVNSFTAAAWNLSTGNIGSATEIHFRFMGFLA